MKTLTLSDENLHILTEILKGSITYLENQRAVNPKQLNKLRELRDELQKSQPT
jgi:hypothetical protein